jgi:hypothetical protein
VDEILLLEDVKAAVKKFNLIVPDEIKALYEKDGSANEIK